MDEQDQPINPAGSAPRWLPWAMFGTALALYLATLCGWITTSSLSVVARVTGWDWAPPLNAPLFYVVTLPFRLLPVSLQPIALNVFTAVCAAGALLLLTRSVMLLPHDRTREQRQREQSEFSLLSAPGAWIPPVFAALVCGLQLTFWEHATAASVEMFDLLVFAYLIRCLLEYRVSLRDGWLYQFAALYGLGMTNNWALIGFLPFFAVAVVWIRGRMFFDIEFLARMAICGMLGLGLYLLLPLLAWLSDPSMRFWEYLRTELGAQKAMVLGYPKSRALLLSLTSILPVVVMGIRWPSSFGDTSAAGAMLTNFMFRVVHAMFLAAILWVAFDPKFSPRSIGYGFPYLTFYYLGALAAGYYLGYFLLVYGAPGSTKAWRRPRAAARALNRAVVVAAWLIAAAIPAALAWRNISYVRSTNGPALLQYAELAAQSVGDARGVVISDDTYQLMSLAAGLSLNDRLKDFVLVESRSLAHPIYHRQQFRRHPSVWPDSFVKWEIKETIDGDSLNNFLLRLAQSNALHYAHPSFGSFFEVFYTRPRGMAFELTPYATEILPPPQTAEAIARNQEFWQRAGPALNALIPQVEAQVTNALVLGAWYSRALNTWGVDLQRARQLQAAGSAFQLALQLNPENLNAAVNARFNRQLQEGKTEEVELTQREMSMLRTYGYGAGLLTANGPFDEPDSCFRIGQQFALGGNFRQALIHFERARILKPQNLQAWFSAANMYLMGQVPDTVLSLIGEMRQNYPAQMSATTNAIELLRLESLALLGKGRVNDAERMLLEAEQRHPKDETILNTLFYVYFGSLRFSNVLGVIDRQLAANPDNTRALLNQGATYIQMKDYERAIAPLDRVLKMEPANQAALRNRAIAHLHSGQLDAAQRDYEALRVVMPTSYFVYYGLGEIAYRRKLRSEAVAQYEKFLDYAPRGTPEIELVTQRMQSLQQSGSGE